jgi:hypothetical protein
VFGTKPRSSGLSPVNCKQDMVTFSPSATPAPQVIWSIGLLFMPAWVQIRAKDPRLLAIGQRTGGDRSTRPVRGASPPWRAASVSLPRRTTCTLICSSSTFGHKPLLADGPTDIYDLINERYEKASILLTSDRAQPNGRSCLAIRFWPAPAWIVWGAGQPYSPSRDVAIGSPNGRRRRGDAANSSSALIPVNAQALGFCYVQGRYYLETEMHRFDEFYSPPRRNRVRQPARSKSRSALCVLTASLQH